MSNVPPPLLGFNNNVRHRGRIFHIQTEDSGLKNPRIVTHLFADGGRIIKTTRTEYAEHVARADVQVFVRSLMKEQHKGMFTCLRLGELDALLESVCGPFEQAPHSSQSRISVTLPAPSESPLLTARPSELGAEPFVTERSPAPDLHSQAPPSEDAASDKASLGKRAPLSNPNLRRVTPSAPPQNAAAFELDVAALERLPAPIAPAPLLPRLDRTPEPAHPPRASSPAQARKNPPPTAGNGGPPASLSRPSSRFAAAPPKTAQSIFGDGVISEQSLDEVILSYLAEDLDGSSE